MSPRLSGDGRSIVVGGNGSARTRKQIIAELGITAEEYERRFAVAVAELAERARKERCGEKTYQSYRLGRGRSRISSRKE